MSATVTNLRYFGEAFVGRKWTSEGMSWLVIDAGKIRLEVDYHDSAAALRSLGLPRTG